MNGIIRGFLALVLRTSNTYREAGEPETRTILNSSSQDGKAVLVCTIMTIVFVSAVVDRQHMPEKPT